MANQITMRGLTDAIGDLDVTGVRRNYATPPINADRPELPALWQELPSVTNGEHVFSCDAQNSEATAVFVIAIAAYGQGTQSDKFNQTIDMVDALQDVIRSGVWTYSNFIDFTIAATTAIQLQDAQYWGLRCTLTARN